MKKALFFFAAAALVISIQSCKKCGQCEVGGVKDNVRFCEKDNQTAYDVAKASCDVRGGKWVTK